MPNALISSERIITEFDNQMISNGFDQYSSPFIASLTDPIKGTIRDIAANLEAYYNRNMLEFAANTDLDEKAAEFGIIRGESGIPFDDTLTNFYVTLKTGLAKDYTLDVNSPLVIPRTAISIVDINGIGYSVPEDLVINPNEASVFSPISANSGVTNSVPVGSITTIFVDYTKLINFNNTKTDIDFGCYNNKALTGAINTYSDDGLRDAAFLRIQSMNNTNADAIRFHLANYGITNVKFIKDMFGYGTLGVVLKIGGSPLISSNTIAILNDVLTNICPFVRVVTPDVLTVRLSINVIFSKNTPNIEVVKTDIVNAINEHFLTFEIGQQLNPQIITDKISNISYVEKINIKCMEIDDRPCLLTIQPALDDQIFALSLNSPITFTA